MLEQVINRVPVTPVQLAKAQGQVSPRLLKLPRYSSLVVEVEHHVVGILGSKVIHYSEMDILNPFLDSPFSKLQTPCLKMTWELGSHNKVVETSNFRRNNKVYAQP